MKHVGVRSNAKDIVSQDQLNASAGDFKKDGSVQMTGAFNEAPFVAATVNGANYLLINAIAANSIQLPANTTLEQIVGGVIGATRRIWFNGAGCTLVRSAYLIIFGTTGNIAPGAGDWAEFEKTSSSDDIWTMISYHRKDGTALVSAGGFTEAQVRATPLDGLSLASGAAVVATDTVLISIGKLQAQLNSGVFRIERIATTSVGQTSYTVPNGYIAGQILVWFNGALLDPADYTATTGTTVVLASGAVTTSDTMSVGVLSALRAQDDSLLQYTVAALPSASANAFKQRWCANMAGRPGPVYSDGTNWRRYVDDSIVTV